MYKLLRLATIFLLVTACTSIDISDPKQTETVNVNVPVAILTPLTSTMEPEPGRLKATATVAPSPTTTSPSLSPQPLDEVEALNLMYPDGDTSAYKVILSSAYRKEGSIKQLVLTDNTLASHCSTCPVYVEAALFTYHMDVWHLENLQQIAAEFYTNGDNSPTATVIPFGPDKDGIVFNGGYQGQGYLIATDIYVTDVDGQFKEVLSLTTFESNRLTDTCFTQQLCYEYGTTVDFIRGDNNIYFDMDVTTSGTKLAGELLVDLTGVETYTFTGKVYTLTKNRDAVAITPSPGVSPIPTAVGLQGPGISYSGISFMVDPILGDKIYVDQAYDSLGCTHFTFAPEGSCVEVGCVTVCPVAQYREEILFGADIIDGLKSVIERKSNDFFPSLMTHILLRSQTQQITFQGGSGIRAIVMKGQNLVFANNESVGYEFHGLTMDDQYYVVVIFPIDNPILLSTYDPTENTNEAAIPVPESSDDDRQMGVVMREYNQEVQWQLDVLDSSSFIPDLVVLDSLVASLQVSPPASLTQEKKHALLITSNWVFP